MHGFSSHLHDRDELARDIACYYGMISLMDRQIGTILDRLQALRLASDTLVVFTSDHGHLFGQHGLTGKVVVENRHEPTTVHLKTYVEERYKLTVYFQRDYGELFDLATDPGEVDNLWDVPEARGLKNDLIRKLLFAEMGKEPLPMPRIAGA